MRRTKPTRVVPERLFTRRSPTRPGRSRGDPRTRPYAEGVRVAIVTESFLPQVNGVTNSVLRVLDYLHAEGHQAMVIAPGTAATPKRVHGFPIHTLTSWGLPGYAQVRVSATPSFSLERMLEDFAPDVVHLAAPVALGYRAALATARLSLPSVAIYQTDIPAYLSRYGVGQAEPLVWWRVREIHSLATRTLAPSSYSVQQLIDHDIPRVHTWGRGVDAVRFHPSKRDEAWRRHLAPNGERIIGYVGRLAAEKQVEDLAVLRDIPGTRLVIVGDGPCRPELEQRLPEAAFLGQLGGEDLARAYAGFDVFVTPGELETFGQTIQESMASGVPVIAPRRGGPIDLVAPSHTGWLYEPRDLGAMRGYVADLIGDDAKREAFSRAARDTVAHRTWHAVCGQLYEHYRASIAACDAAVV